MSLHLDPDKCLACTTCVVHCPVAEATPEFMGPRMIGPAFERFRLLGVLEDPSLSYCANCKNCEIACPQNVPVATINMLARLAQCRENPPSFRDWIVAHGEVLARLLRFVPSRLKNFGIHLSFTRSLLDRIGIAKNCPMPDFAPKSFRDQMQSLRQEKNGKEVFLFPGCYINYYDPGTGFDLVWLLRKAGYTVRVPREFVCCGVPLISSGFGDDARKNAQKNAEVICSVNARHVPVITPCPSCRLMLNHELAEFFPEVVEKTGKPTVMDAQAFLLGLIRSGELNLKDARGDRLSCIYHAPCHLRAQGEGLPGLDLLRLLPGMEVENANAGCCGISGSYGFKKEKYEIARSVGSRLFETVRASGKRFVASECGTCRLQIHGATNLPAIHPVSFVRAALEGRELKNA